MLANTHDDYTQHGARRRRHADLLWTWEAVAEEYHMLISKCIQTGYHPNVYHKYLLALQKPRKADYSDPRAWRLVQLLSTMGE